MQFLTFLETSQDLPMAHGSHREGFLWTSHALSHASQPLPASLTPTGLLPGPHPWKGMFLRVKVLENNTYVETRNKTQDCSRQIETYCHAVDIWVTECCFRPSGHCVGALSQLTHRSPLAMTLSSCSSFCLLRSCQVPLRVTESRNSAGTFG